MCKPGHVGILMYNEVQNGSLREQSSSYPFSNYRSKFQRENQNDKRIRNITGTELNSDLIFELIPAATVLFKPLYPVYSVWRLFYIILNSYLLISLLSMGECLLLSDKWKTALSFKTCYVICKSAYKLSKQVEAGKRCIQLKAQEPVWNKET